MRVPGQEALRRLQAGNRRFREGRSENGQSGEGRPSFSDLTAGQEPFAAVLACSDSRVPVEMIFDQGPGHLFVVRVAGCVAGPMQLGSLEFAVEALGVRLILVLGHTDCRAVAASLDPDLFSWSGRVGCNLGTVTSQISRVLDKYGEHGNTEKQPSPEEAERLHAAGVAKELALQSELLAPWVRTGELLVAGSIYDLKTGQVELLEEV